MMDDSSARFHPELGRRSRRLRQIERLQYNRIQLSFSAEIDRRISSCTLHEMKVSLTIFSFFLAKSQNGVRYPLENLTQASSSYLDTLLRPLNSDVVRDLFSKLSSHSITSRSNSSSHPNLLKLLNKSLLEDSGAFSIPYPISDHRSGDSNETDNSSFVGSISTNPRSGHKSATSSSASEPSAGSAPCLSDLLHLAELLLATDCPAALKKIPIFSTNQPTEIGWHERSFIVRVIMLYTRESLPPPIIDTELLRRLHSTRAFFFDSLYLHRSPLVETNIKLNCPCAFARECVLIFELPFAPHS
ncbi:unnamed protein product [Protopolystoma xenopodis]|uniref:Uncharacterized protein n=1 Tax=Protopolystoma xenopodis TaxID=117903 RepID=A0A3S4ZRG3_9PLAT|nr:unnamed protein product [Protopolystoma xenopodis]